MTEYAWGIMTLPLALGALALAAGITWLLIAVARHLWAKTHYALMDTVKLRRNLARIRLNGEPEDDRPEYLDAANKFRDALLESPRMYTLGGLGWRLVLVRESRSDEDQTAGTDEARS